MTADEIIDQIWQLPWYSVLKIAIYDDFILLAKVWPCVLVIILVSLVLVYLTNR